MTTPAPSSRSTLSLNVVWLASLGDRALSEFFEAGERVRFRAGQPIVGELEVGDTMYLVLSGNAKATVRAGQGEVLEIGALGPGDTCGELALITRELRSATVTATSDVEALRIERDELHAFVRRHPEIAVHFAKEVASRLDATDRALDAALAQAPQSSASPPLLQGAAAMRPARGSFRRAWRELVVSRKKELPFIALASFVVTLIAVRLLVVGFKVAGADLFDILRDAYTGGFSIVILSAALSFMGFSAAVRRIVAVAYGVGFALIVNEASVFLAFDTFYLDMTTRDPALAFSVEELYRRSEANWAIALVLAILVQATYLRRFYRRTAFIVGARIRALLAR
jgi:CRP-like cAMP-binding protein